MIFHPENTVLTGGSHLFSKDTRAVAHPCLCKEVIKEFFHGFTFSLSMLNLDPTNELIFRIGSASPLTTDGFSYAINVTKEGICITAKSEHDLILGFMTLIDRIKAIDTDDGECVASVDCCQIRDMPLYEMRSVHFCVFPQTELWELERFVRFCGALKFSHVILEFWGTLRYDVMKELSWPTAFSKEQIRPIVALANDLGMEIVPMFNHWGHAPASRDMHGKHVVLDQNPALQSYFDESGWCWDIRKEKVRALLRSVRNELIELCGSGGYFHIGCDEADHFDPIEESVACLCEFINEISADLKARGRRTLLWGDMLLCHEPNHHPENKYTCNATSSESQKYLLEHLDHDLIVADWQYKATHVPVETALTFRDAGFECLLCPWDRGYSQLYACSRTVREYGSKGLLHTTWHTLSSGMHFVMVAALSGFEALAPNPSVHFRPFAASLLRKVCFVNGDYERAGWSKSEIGDIV